MFYFDEDGEIHSAYHYEVYKKNDNIKEYFDGIKEVHFYNYDDLHTIASKSNTADILDDFLDEFELNVDVPRIVKYEYTVEEAKKKKLPYSYSNDIRFSFPKNLEKYKWKESRIDGLQENLDNIACGKNVCRAKFIWKVMLSCFKYYKKKSPDVILNGEAVRNKRCENFTSSDVDMIRSSKWLVNYKGELVSPKDVTVQELDEYYDVNNVYVKQFMQFLEIEEESMENLSNRQKEDLLFMKKLRNIIGEERLEKLLKEEENKKIAELNSTIPDEDIETQQPIKEKISIDSSIPIDEINFKEKSQEKQKRNYIELSDEHISRVMKDVGSRAEKKVAKRKAEEKRGYEPKIQKDEFKHVQSGFDDDTVEVEINVPDEDEFTKASVDYKTKIEDAKERAAKELEEIQAMEELEERAQKAEKYSFEWFLALLDLELEASANSSDGREVSIKFGRIVREAGTERTVILSNPDRYIPMVMEELSNIELKMVARDGSNHKAIIEAMSVKDYTLKVKLRSSDEINNIEFDKIRECSIKAVSPSFLLEALVEEFKELQFSLEDNLQSKLPKNVKFVFGPPGTGKTTHLSRHVIKPFMEEDRNRVLVVTPTNKAADVIARRIMEIYKDDKSWKDWLIRFGTTNDEEVEKEGVYRDKTVDLGKFRRCVIITTISRYPYDFFLPSNGKRLHLHDIDWDYVVIDEASMIPLANITYLLYNAKPEQFIIAGDPFQIEPITSVDLWKNENIYEMVQLKSFTEPHTVPHEYEIENLTTQYRSLPSIGTIFSKFAYGGVLKHDRSEDSCRNLNIDDVLPLRNLSIVKFPVSKYEGIYRAKRLTGSPYQVYIGLFVVEFTKFLSNLLVKCNPEEKFSIGVIAPYRAEASLIDKLLVQMDLPENIDVQAGTIHGFQGDECDIILCVFNPPPFISNSSQMFLNKKNIINVAISRAKDYLIMIMPDNRTANIGNLYQVLTVEKLIKEEHENFLADFSAKELEKLMFGTEDYIESNTFNTNHQSVNVYGLPEYYYEVRSEDNALDVQIHKKAIRNAEGNDPAIGDIEVADDSPTDDGNAFAIDIDTNHDVDEDGWDCHEIAQLIALYVEAEKDNENAQVLAERLQEKMAEKYKGRDDEIEKMSKRDIMAIGYKLMTIKCLAQGIDAQETGASEVEYKMWQMYRMEHDRFTEVLNGKE